MNDDAADLVRVRELLGREPRGRFEVVVRDPDGDPVVLRNAPLLDDGTPMPTRYWLCGPAEIKRIGQLEAAGGVNAAEAAIDPGELAAAHDRYAAERDAEIPDGHAGPRPFGGVGGTRAGVKCLHAHWAWYLAGGDDPVGRWIAERLEESGRERGPLILIGPSTTTVALTTGGTIDIPYGADSLTERWLTDDPPRPESLTNAFGAIDDHLDDIERVDDGFADVDHLVFRGAAATAFARLEVGSSDVADRVDVARADAEEVFRIVATDTRAERHHHPGLPSGHVHSITATCVIVLAHMRRLGLDSVTIDTSVPADLTGA